MAKKSEKLDPSSEWASSRISVFLQSTITTVIIIAIFAGAGYFLDKQLGSFPTLFIIGMVIGYPITQIYIYKKFKNNFKK